MNDQKFEQWLQETLATDVTAPEDFTAHVMDRVSAMPQEYPKKNTVDKRKLKRMMTALAACAAIVVLIPVGLMMMPMGKSAPAADCAAPEEAMDEAAVDTEFFVEDAYNDAAGLERMEELDYAEIAEVLQLPSGTVKSRINRAKAALKTALLKSGNIFGGSSVIHTETNGKEA